MSVLDDLRQNVIEGQAADVAALVKQAMEDNLPPEKILNEGLIAAMSEVGRLFEANEVYVPEMLIAARAMKAGLKLLRPSLADADVQAVGKVVIGTVQGDLHDIGKNLVAMMLEGAGFDVIDLGVDISPHQFVQAVKENNADLVGFSALLTTTMPMMQTNVEALAEAGLRNKVKVMIGGAPVTAEFANQIGADIYAPDASSAASRAKQALS